MEQQTPSLIIHTQYVKDLSFEGPQKVMDITGETPKVTVSFDFSVENMSEVQEGNLSFHVNAASEKSSIFVMELSYCGIFSLRGVPEEQHEAVLFAAGAPMLFPFARHIIASTISNAGFPPVMLDPINFAEFYKNKKARSENLK
jgi:preprotein translocase subunit SecB